jgi:hypothetical protein
MTQAMAPDFAARSEPLASRFVRRFRLPAFLRRCHESLAEVSAGKREGEDAEGRISNEAEEETEFSVRNPRRVFEAYMNPGNFGEKLTFLAARAGDSKTKAKILTSWGRRSVLGISTAPITGRSR